MAPEVGIDPKLSDAELVTLAVMQGLSGFTSEDPVAAVRMRFTCGTCFPTCGTCFPTCRSGPASASACARPRWPRAALPIGRGFLPFLRGRGPRGEPDAIGMVSPVEALAVDEAQRRRTLDSGG